jgi:cytochrome P450
MPEHMKKSVAVMENVATKHFAIWESNTVPAKALSMLERLTFDIATKVLVGDDFSEEQTNYILDEFHLWLKAFFTVPLDLPGTTMRRGMLARERLLQEFEKCIQKRQENKSDFSGDVLGRMVAAPTEDNEILSMEELKDQVLLQLFAGHDTTSSTLTSAMYFLHKHPEFHERLRKEIDELCPR